MKKTNNSFQLVFIAPVFLSNFVFPQSFTYYGPSIVTVPFSGSNATATYYFSYTGLSGLVTPGLIIAVDGTVVNNDLCHNPTTPSSYSLSLAPGAHTISFKLMSVDPSYMDCYTFILHKQYTLNVEANFKVRIENVFVGGTINVSNSVQTSPYDKSVDVGTSFTIGAIEQSNSGYNWIWNANGTNNSEWKKRPWGGSYAHYNYYQHTSVTVGSNDKNASIKAYLRKVCNQSFTSNFVGISYKGTVTVNSSTYNAPTSDFGVVEQDTIKFSVPYYVNLSNIDYLFDKWNDDNTSSSRTVLPNTHYDYVANYIGKPSNSSRNLHFNTSDPEGSPVKVMWNQHPNTNVTKYEIWRKVGFNVTATAYKIATINRTSASTYTYTDYDIGLKRRGSKDDEVSYDVKSYYSTEGTLSGNDYCTIYGDLLPKENDEIVNKEAVEEIIEYEISNYPNPYNPTTTINYKIKEMGNVNITVYDALGREVSVLVNDFKQPGEYNVLFDGSNLSNGVYYYRMQSGNFLEKKKMIMMK